MITLSNERYAPTTSTPGFLEAPLDVVASALVAWHSTIYPNVGITEIAEPFPQSLQLLEPLQPAANARQLLVATRSGWTAYFSCGLVGNDPDPFIHVLGARLGCRGLLVGSRPDTVGVDKAAGGGRMGSVRFTLYGPSEGSGWGIRRHLHAMRDGERWVWDEKGSPLPFEDISRYAARRKRDRLTSEMLDEYCRALGVDALSEDEYLPHQVLVEAQIDRPQRTMTFAELQACDNIIPGMARGLPQ